MLLVARTRIAPSPRWLVRTGDAVVGPVATELLVRGVREGRVPAESWVRDERSTEWRPLQQVRELNQGLEPSVPEKYARAAEGVAAAHDAGEVFLFLLHGAVLATSSTVAALHRVRPSSPLPVTSCVFNLGDERLGELVPADDPALRLARAGECVHGQPSEGPAQLSVARRLAPGGLLSAVMMVPMLYGTELAALLELGRVDHGYRRGDADSLQRLSAFAIGRLEELSA